MKSTKSLTPFAAWAMAGLLALAAAGCGDKPQAPAPASSAAPAAAEAKPAEAAGPVSESEHERFEKKYVEMCVKGQQHNPDSPVKSDQELGPLCECIAKTISKRLSKAEAVHFLNKKEIPIDIVMMGNSASDTCAQAAK